MNKFLDQNWSAFNLAIRGLSEPQLKVRLKQELKGKCRVSYLKKIHTRLCRKRTNREYKQMLEKRTFE